MLMCIRCGANVNLEPVILKCVLMISVVYVSFSFSSSISTPDSIGLEIEKKCQCIFPLQNVFIRKVKVLKKPKFDLMKLMEVHGDSAEDTGAAMDKVAAANTVKSMSGAGGRL